ncbi:MAG: C_GCAxxG_C_C family protein [Actinobacteria bacterium]|nr:C_GCAxxG_C_C family protein [Actinomycetota bacterium]MBM3713315.1 C_GCAxxG_C_C family protein [Actinomycetota bacterium]
MEREKTEQAYDLAYKYEKEWRVCSQCTIKSLFDVYEIDNKDIFRALSGFGGGGATQGDGMCGAYVAGMIFLGLKLGRDISDIGADSNDPRGFKKNKALTILLKKLRDKFINEYTSIICHQIHRKLYGRPFYLLDSQELEKFDLAGGHDWGCTSVCGNAAKWTVEIYEEFLKNE